MEDVSNVQPSSLYVTKTNHELRSMETWVLLALTSLASTSMFVLELLL